MKIPSQKSIKKTSVANRKVKERKGTGEKVQEEVCQGGGHRSKGALNSDFCGRRFLSIQETVCQHILCEACLASGV